MSERYEFSDGGIEDASNYLGGNLHLQQLADDCIAATGAKLHEVLLVMLFEIEGIANERGMPGPQLLMAGAQNRAEFRGEVEAAAKMRAAIKRIFKLDDDDID